MKLAIYSDFDGTITLRDSNDALVDRYVGATNRQAYDKLFLEGKGTLWEILDTSLQACQVPLEEAIVFLRQTVEIDRSFVAFHAWCEKSQLPLSVLSAGLFEVVQAYMLAEGLDLPIAANRARRFERHFGLEPADLGCPTGVDKGAVLLQAKREGLYTVFIGDGYSDRLAVPHADLVYAKSSLARYCTERNFPYVPFSTFKDVQADLETRLPHMRAPD